MYKDKPCFAVIAAAGAGLRFSSGGLKNSGNTDLLPKQFHNLLGKPVLAHTLDIFESNSRTDYIVISTNASYFGLCGQIIEKYGYRKKIELAEGGENRQKSVYNGLLSASGQSAANEGALAVIHDGARPLTAQKTVNLAIEGAYLHGAAAAAVSVSDTIKIAKDGFIKETPDRTTLYATQTPQVFRLGLILSAHKKAMDDGFMGYDDATLVERLGCPVFITEGSCTNIKITNPMDLSLAKLLMS